MKEKPILSSCERAAELVSVLYGEASEGEARGFQVHLKECATCRGEFAAFVQVRESIGEWRDEALTGFASSQAGRVTSPEMADSRAMKGSPAMTGSRAMKDSPAMKGSPAMTGEQAAPVMAMQPARKSAIAALRQFFDLSPLWLKGAVGFAAVVFCVLAAVAVMRPRPEVPQVAAVDPDRVYTQADVDRAVQQALAQQEQQHLAVPKPIIVESTPASNTTTADATTANNATTGNNPTTAKRGRRPEGQRPFSRAEREQLAADLRLLSGDDELDLDLPVDQNHPR